MSAKRQRTTVGYRRKERGLENKDQILPGLEEDMPLVCILNGEALACEGVDADATAVASCTGACSAEDDERSLSGTRGGTGVVGCERLRPVGVLGMVISEA